MRADSAKKRHDVGSCVGICSADVLPYESHSQGVEEHAFADDGGVRDSGGGDEFTEREGIELEDGVEDGGNSEGSDNGDQESEVFLCGGVVPKNRVGAREDNDHEERYDEKSGFEKVQSVSGDDEGGDADKHIPYRIQDVEQEPETWFFVVFIDDFRRMP